MAGWEKLTPDQLIFITWVVTYVVTIYSVSIIIKQFTNLKISKNIKLRVEKELLNELLEQNNVDKPSFFNKIKLWWSERKTRKEEYY